MISEKMLRLMKDKYFINTSRGELVDEDSLLKMIQSNHFKGLALDVFSDENRHHRLDIFRKLSKDKNIILTPHISGATYESMKKTEEFIARKLVNRIKPLTPFK